MHIFGNKWGSDCIRFLLTCPHVGYDHHTLDCLHLSKRLCENSDDLSPCHYYLFRKYNGNFKLVNPMQEFGGVGNVPSGAQDLLLILCAGIIPDGLGGHIGYQESNSGQMYARKKYLTHCSLSSAHIM